MHDYPLEQGDTLGSAPKPAIPTGTNEHINGLARKIFLILSVQPQLVALEHANHAANSDIAFAGQNESILNRQRTLEPLLAEAFRFVYHILLDMTAAHLDSTDPQSASGSKEDVAKHSASTTPSVAHRIRGRLCNVPMTTMDSLHHMFMTGCITHNDYRTMALQVAGVNSQLVSNERMTRQQIAELQHGGKKPQTLQKKTHKSTSAQSK